MAESLLGFILIITPLVFFHELGHFALARRAGVQVDVFSVGFGPELLGYTDRKGTRWRLALIPLGGYVKIKGETLGESGDEQGSLATASLLQRFAIIAAGPAANIVLAFGILFAVNLGYGVYTQGVYQETGIGTVAEDSPARLAGLQSGDIITRLNGVSIEAFEDIIRTMRTADGAPMSMEYVRGDSSYHVQITPTLTPDHRYILGVTGPKMLRTYPGVSDSLGLAFQQLTWFGGQIVQGLGGLLLGTADIAELGGPIKIAQYSGDILVSGAEQFLLFAAMLSVNLALINLFPIPGLDGGHLLWLSVEAVMRRPPPAQWIQVTSNIGIIFVLGLILLITFKDIYEIFI